MPRSRGSSSRSSRPSGSRSSSTMAAPAPAKAPVAPPKTQTQAGSQQPGMLAQMAATAGSVAIGSTIGHGVSSMLFGGRSEHAEAPPAAQQTNAGTCEFQAKEFTKCLDAADVQTCNWFLEQLKACQAAASKY